MTLEKLIEELKAAAEAKTVTIALTRDQVLDLAAWFETARNTVEVAEHRRARIDELSHDNLRLEERTRALERELRRGGA